MSNADKYLMQDADYQAYTEELVALNKRIVALEQAMKQRRIELIARFCAEYSAKYGFRIDAGMKVICSVEMHEYAETHYIENLPHRDDLADYHFPLAYEMKLTDIKPDGIELGGYGSVMVFPADLVQRAVRYYTS